MGSKLICFCALIAVVATAGFPSVFAVTPGRFASVFFSNRLSVILKWAWLQLHSRKAATSPRAMMKFESGYTVETVFDGSKLGIEPHSVEVLSNGDLLVLDTVNSNIYKIASPLSICEGAIGHVDGNLKEARMNHPKSFDVDDRGNIYVADTMNRAVRKISDVEVTTIAGGRWSRGSSHIDGPSEDAKFSDDFEVVYVGSSCSLLIVDKGNKAIREIHLRFDDCIYQYGSGFPSGIFVLLAACFFGYMLALLQQRISAIISSSTEPMVQNTMDDTWSTPFHKAMPSSGSTYTTAHCGSGTSVSFASMWKLLSCFAAPLTFILDSFGRRNKENDHKYQQQQHHSPWPMQESFSIPDEDEPPSAETRTPTPHKKYPFMSKEAEKMNHFKLGNGYPNRLEDERQQKPKESHQPHLHYKYPPVGSRAYYERDSEGKSGIFGTTNEDELRQRSMRVKQVSRGNIKYEYHNAPKGVSYMDYSRNY